nr:hypothetical protein Itr_chr09CG01530 [Ipomoea trifida]
MDSLVPENRREDRDVRRRHGVTSPEEAGKTKSSNRLWRQRNYAFVVLGFYVNIIRTTEYIIRIQPGPYYFFGGTRPILK